MLRVPLYMASDRSRIITTLSVPCAKQVCKSFIFMDARLQCVGPFVSCGFFGKCITCCIFATRVGNGQVGENGNGIVHQGQLMHAHTVFALIYFN